MGGNAGCEDPRKIPETSWRSDAEPPELPDTESTACLDDACANSPDARPVLFDAAAWQGEAPLLPDPERAGPYRILRRIGEGGMGIVYLAERDDGEYRQQVAVKVIKSGLPAAGLLRRFRNERQILAELNHPQIARILDAGTAESGQPYYAMEYFDGVPVTTYCNRNHLSPRQRVELFSTICVAVEYAHRKLIIHNDLKPANILVGADGTPKLLDFGLARVFAEATGQGDAVTATVPMMTLGYASPEQVAGERLTMSTDVYSLGVLLYELLTGASPYTVRESSPLEICRAVCEQMPRLPSTAARQLGAPWQPLKGDLDSIAMMALRKEPDRRYGSVEALRGEIERYLAGLPVLALRGAFWYRWSKYARRYRWALAAAVLVAIGAAGATATVWWEGRQAEQRFNHLRSLAHSMIFEFYDSIQNLPGSTGARQLLAERALEYLRKLEADAGPRRDLQLELAAAYQKIGEVESNNSQGSLSQTAAAAANMQHARRLYRIALRSAPRDFATETALGDVDVKLADVEEQLGDEKSRAASSEEAARLAWKAANRSPGDRRLDAKALQLDAGNLAASGNWTGALLAWQRTVAAYEAAVAATPGDRASANRLALSHDGWARACQSLARQPCAIEHYRQAIAIRAAQLAEAPSDPRLSMQMSYHLIDLAWAEHVSGDQARAVADATRAVDLERAVAAADPRNLMARAEVAKSLLTTGLICREGGDLTRAIALLGESAGLLQEIHSRDPENESTLYHLAWSSAELGSVYRARADWRNAADCYERANECLGRLRLGGKLLGFLDDTGLRSSVPGALAECRRHLAN